MTASDILLDPRLIYVAQRMFSVMDFTCRGVVDLTSGEYALLLEVSESDSGAPLKKLESDFGFIKTPQYLIALLEEKELIRRVRSRSDKRAFSYEATTKGRTRISLADEAIAVALIATNPTLDEEDLGALIDRFRDIALLVPDLRPETMFPSVIVSALFRYHRLFDRSCSIDGIPPLQVALLSIMVSRDIPHDVEYFASKTGILDAIVEFQLKTLVGKRLALYDGGYSITERGRERVKRLTEEFATVLADDTSSFEPEVQDGFRSLAGYALYLFE